MEEKDCVPYQRIPLYLILTIPIIIMHVVIAICKETGGLKKQGDGSLFDNSLLPLAR